jgi:hypothetical protein
MRNAFVGAIVSCLVFCPGAFAQPVMAEGDPVVMPDTPSGEGEPNTIVCRAPQPIAGTDQLGPKICGYNYEWSQFRTHGRDLAPDGKTVVDLPMVANPTGKGNPDKVTCRKPKHLPGPGRNLGPEVCLANRLWADLITNHKMVSAEGVLVAEPRWMPRVDTFSYTDPLQGYRVGGN